MFSRYQRISTALFDEILKKGVSFRSPNFLLVVWDTKDGKYPKIAVVTPKKTASGAVKRNKFRRQARAWLEIHIAKHLQKNMHVILFINTAWVGPFPLALQEELKKLFSRTKTVV